MKTTGVKTNIRSLLSKEITEAPIVIILAAETSYVATMNSYAALLGVKKGMHLDLVNYFCRMPVMITVDNWDEIPFDLL